MNLFFLTDHLPFFFTSLPELLLCNDYMLWFFCLSIVKFVKAYCILMTDEILKQRDQVSNQFC